MKKYGFDKLFALAMVVYSLVGAVIFMFTKIMFPIPFAEIVSFSVYYLDFSDPNFRSVTLFILYAGVYILSLVSLTAYFFIKKKISVFYKLHIAIPLVFDFAIHGYAFLFSSGYNFNYLFAAVFDVLTLIAVFYENMRIKKLETKNADIRS